LIDFTSIFFDAARPRWRRAFSPLRQLRCHYFVAVLLMFRLSRRCHQFSPLPPPSPPPPPFAAFHARRYAAAFFIIDC
jgi:hypothetical protein